MKVHTSVGSSINPSIHRFIHFYKHGYYTKKSLAQSFASIVFWSATKENVSTVSWRDSNIRYAGEDSTYACYQRGRRTVKSYILAAASTCSIRFTTSSASSEAKRKSESLAKPEPANLLLRRTERTKCKVRVITNKDVQHSFFSQRIGISSA